MDREEVSGLVGRKVAVRLTNVEARGVELVATLEGVREDGVVLSGIGELGPGPTLFCPWESLHRVRDRPPWLRPPHGELGDGPGGPAGHEPFELREVPAEEEAPEPPAERRREPSARNLERVVAVAQDRTAGGVTVALTSLELYGEGVGVLRWRASLGENAFREELDFGFGIPEPVFEIREGSGRGLPWSPRGGGASDEESDGEIEVRELPETGELHIEVVRLATAAYGPDSDYLGEGASLDGPWNFRFSL